LAVEAQQVARSTGAPSPISELTYLAEVAAALGACPHAALYLDEARKHVQASTVMNPNYNRAAALIFMRLGVPELVRHHCIESRARWPFGEATFPKEAAICDTVMSLVLANTDVAGAKQHLDSAQRYATASGSVEVQLRCYHAASALARRQKLLGVANDTCKDAIHLAHTCGYGLLTIDLYLEQAEVQLASQQWHAAAANASLAYLKASDQVCGYAWGMADSLHLVGVAHARLGDTAKARYFLTRAAEKRKPLEHPGLKETEDELRKLDG
jgi:hypothetical protein